MKEVYQRIWELAKPYYERGRPMDIAHIEWMMPTAMMVCEKENLDDSLLLPLVILHDIGYSKFSKENSFNLNIRKGHMKEGAKLAREILKKVEYPENKIEKIVYYISVHDNWAFGDIVVFDKDIILGTFNDLDFSWTVSKEGLPSIRNLFDGTNKGVVRYVHSCEKFFNLRFYTETMKNYFIKQFEEIERKLKMNIIKYGGSKVYPVDSYDNGFIDHLIEMVGKYPNQKFMIIIGGGKLARIKQDSEPDADQERKDWLGIEATWENAQYVIDRFISKGVGEVCPEVIKDPTKKVDGYRIYFAGGWKPGNSTDYVTMMLARTYAAERVIKISDFEVVKDFSPLKVKDMSKADRDNLLTEAKDLPKATWQKMVDLVGTEWVPGLNTPLDPLAANLGLENQTITLYICKESELDNVLFGNLETFKGTIVTG